MIDMLVRQDECRDRFWRNARRRESSSKCTRGKSGIDENTRAIRFDYNGIAAASAAENADVHAPARQRAA